MNVLLESKGICKYFGGLKAVDEIGMKVKKGEIFGIIGPNGAGKTTFFNICTGVYPPTAGKIFFDNEDITRYSSEKVASVGMARTFQNIKLFKYMSVLDNVKIGFHKRTKTAMWDALLHTKTYKEDEEFVTRKGKEVLEIVGLSKYQDEKAGNLSYGWQRRVEIARALALDPKILLLDEPAAGMNPNETTSLMELLRKLNGDGYTIVVIEHDMRFVMNLCHNIMVLNFGKKICEGTPEVVTADKEVNDAYFGKGILMNEVIAHAEN